MSSSVCSGNRGSSRQSLSLTTPEYDGPEPRTVSILIPMGAVLREDEWQALASDHRSRVLPWVEPWLSRRVDARRDPVDDFLFTYYSYRPSHLLTWHPGLGVICAGASADAFLEHRGYRRTAQGIALDPAAFAKRERAARWVVQLMQATLDRPAALGCFGMHEWAMVYRATPHEVRHQSWPLRMPLDDIATITQDVGVRCSHFDAFRFFTEPARPLNAVQLTRDDQLASEQPGCLHAGMDLYKWAYKLSPLTSSDLVADCFELAREIRTVDMRASPYDLSELGLDPIAVETSRGRDEYVRRQRDFAGRASLLRRRLLRAAESILDSLPDVNSAAAPYTPNPVAERRRG